MPSLTCFKVRFTPSWLMIFLTVFVVGVFIRLGLWQLQRADEKEKMISAQTKLAQMAPIDWDFGQKPPLQYQKIKVRGHYLTDVFLLDNQHYQHQFGYDVLSPLVLADGRVLMVDRGWVKADPLRKEFPEINSPKGEQLVQGSVYFPSINPWLLGPGLEKKENNVIILEALDVKLVNQILQKETGAFIIRLDKQGSDGFVREWTVVSMSPQRHLGYALQWFAMALVIVILFLVLNLKKKNEEKKF